MTLAVGAAGAPLGPITKSASDPSPTGAADLTPRGRWAAWNLRDTAGDLLPGTRVAKCGWRPRTHHGVAVTSKGERYGIGNVRVCGAIWTCPVCAAKVAGQRADDLNAAIGTWRRRGGAVWLVTFTIRHTKHDDLAANLDAFLASLRWFWSGRGGAEVRDTLGLVGVVRNLETTWGHDNGWHPHSHALFFVPAGVDPVAARAMIAARWLVAVEAHGLSATMQHGVDLQVEAPRYAAGDEVKGRDADRLVGSDRVVQVQEWDDSLAAYVTKMVAAESIESAWTGAHELTWAHIKRTRGVRYTPWMLLASAHLHSEADGDDASRAPALFQEYALAFHGRRQLVWTRGLRDLLNLGDAASDEDLAAAEDEYAVTVLHVPTRAWYWLRTHALVPSMLEFAEAYGRDGLSVFVDAAVSLARDRDAPYAWMRHVRPSTGLGSPSA